ncbi:MAG: HD domain-containing protein [bacterium]
MDSDIVKKTAIYVKSKLMAEPTGHDWYHVERVWRMAKILQAEEGGDLLLVELASLLHDLGDYKRHDFSETKGNLVLDAMMDILDIDKETQSKIMQIVIESQYKGDETMSPSSLEGKIIQDADWLEALGALGIARSFATGGLVGRMMHNPCINPRKNLSKLDYQRKKYEGTSMNYFYEKSLRLPEMMNTNTAKKIAYARVEFMKNFIQEFLDEWEGVK